GLRRMGMGKLLPGRLTLSAGAHESALTAFLAVAGRAVKVAVGPLPRRRRQRGGGAAYAFVTVAESMTTRIRGGPSGPPVEVPSAAVRCRASRPPVMRANGV